MFNTTIGDRYIVEIQLDPSERLDDLLANDLKIIQSREVFSFSMDAVLLARFVTLPNKGKIIDLCTGNGVIPFLLSTRTKSNITGVEIQSRVFDMAERSLMLNRLEDQIQFIRGDIKEMPAQLGLGNYDVVTVNPPYLPLTGGERNDNRHFAIARHELCCTLEDVVRVSSQLVRVGGKVAMVHRPSRLIEIISTLRAYQLEPKRIRMVHPRADQPANMVLIESVRSGQPEVRILPPLIVYKDELTYSDEIYEIYNGRRNGQ